MPHNNYQTHSTFLSFLERSPIKWSVTTSSPSPLKGIRASHSRSARTSNVTWLIASVTHRGGRALHLLRWRKILGRHIHSHHWWRSILRWAPKHSLILRHSRHRIMRSRSLLNNPLYCLVITLRQILFSSKMTFKLSDSPPMGSGSHIINNPLNKIWMASPYFHFYCTNPPLHSQKVGFVGVFFHFKQTLE